MSNGRRLKIERVLAIMRREIRQDISRYVNARLQKAASVYFVRFQCYPCRHFKDKVYVLKKFC